MAAAMKIIGTITQKLLLVLIKTYRYLWSPLFASHCRFYPSCSTYALEAINSHGAIKGLCLTIKRLLRCHPFTSGGLDPVPPSNAINRRDRIKFFKTSDK